MTRYRFELVNRASYAAAILCLILAISGIIGILDDRVDAINLAAPYIVLAASANLLISVLYRRWLRAVTVILPIIMALPLLVSDLSAYSHGVCDGNSIAIIQYNFFKENSSELIDIEWLLGMKPDVIVLEEATNVAHLLVGSYPYQQNCSPKGACSTVILSRIRPSASGGVAKGDPENRGALSAAWMRLPIQNGGGSLTIVGVHLGRPWPFRRFERERAELSALVAKLGRKNIVVAGDFNLPGWTYQMRALQRDLGLERATRAILTWPVRWEGRRWPIPLLGIDHLLTGTGWQARRVRAGPILGSDHRPIMAELVPCLSQTRDRIASAR